ncbi:type II secretion system minor pseudopilin GspK [Amantichitinum ursilacus]|uniref:Type II secretion system protein K n=1 Tax=Amantichitinum ursilacus TaxID=857265 RepID=A0A0N0GR57_9NEIS|nr:type II secretion system minor pseudopilin GspK [Amantichitinum ursilacus]KPC55129.1 putative type II secretion system protein K [Amantichitinum ursilacus]
MMPNRRSASSRSRRQQGIAILTAVGIAALVAALAAWIAWRQALWYRQLENQFDQAEAIGVIRASINLVRLTLRDDARNNQIDHMLEPWNIPIPAIPVENGRAGGRIIEQGGLFNLNNLVDDKGAIVDDQVQCFKRLLTTLQLSTDLADVLADWEDADSDLSSSSSAEDNAYLGMSPPYRAANQRLTDLGSLTRVRGFTPDIIARLQPFVTVVPLQTKVNVNFASAEVLTAVVPNMSLSVAQSVISKRAGRYFKDIGEFRDTLPDSFKAQAITSITVQTTYFINEVEAQFGRVTLRYQALLERTSTDLPRIVWMRRE